MEPESWFLTLILLKVLSLSVPLLLPVEDEAGDAAVSVSEVGLRCGGCC